MASLQNISAGIEHDYYENKTKISSTSQTDERSYLPDLRTGVTSTECAIQNEKSEVDIETSTSMPQEKRTIHEDEIKSQQIYYKDRQTNAVSWNGSGQVEWKSAYRNRHTHYLCSPIGDRSRQTGTSHRQEKSEDNSRIKLTSLGSTNSGFVLCNDEPVLTLYRRHSKDPFFMYNTLSHDQPLQSLSDTSSQLSHDRNVKSHPDIANAFSYEQPLQSHPDTSSHLSHDQLMKSHLDTANQFSHDQHVKSHPETTNQLSHDQHVGPHHGRPKDSQERGVPQRMTGVNVLQPQTKMVKMQSPRVQCCLCAVSVMSALFGMFMLSAGVCLVLNYSFLEVDTSGLPPNLHNEEGKKVVGIILICVGVGALGVSGLVSALYFTACSPRGSTNGSAKVSDQERSEAGKVGEGRPNSNESHGRSHSQGHYNSNGTTAARSAPAGSGARRTSASAMPGSRRTSDPRTAHSRSRNSTPPGSSRPYRHGKKNRHAQNRFKTSLPSHPEEAGGDSQSLPESRHSAASRRLAYPDRKGYVNEGAQLDSDQDGGDTIASASSGSSVANPIINVDSSFVENETGLSHKNDQRKESESNSRQHHPLASVSGASQSSGTDSCCLQDGGELEEMDGRKSRSSIDTLDTNEGFNEGPDDARRRLDNQMHDLIS